ncbi:hypothetical protein LIER_18858 [Lithospermum erythrorhizon]|uniref:Polyprotein n=1 Tax=Lithospermum erythrorhizon TaxID=34254 RepID=A0AAV3QI62_LITER
MPGSPDQNGVAERRTRTLMDMDIVPEINSDQPPPTDSSHKLIVIHAPKDKSCVSQPTIEDPQVDSNLVDHDEEQTVHPEDEQIPLRRSTRSRRSTIYDDYLVYLQEADYNIGVDNDPMSFSEAISSINSNLWMNAMKVEMDSMTSNRIWDLIELPNGVSLRQRKTHMVTVGKLRK